MPKEPLISIIIPAFNRAHLIEETLNSVKSQTYKNWECIVVDDGSTDHTKSIVKTYTDNDERFKFYNRPITHLAGGNGARNYGAEKSQGDWLVFLDSDDVLMPTALLNRMNCGFDYDMLICVTGTFKRELGDSDIIWNKIGSDKEESKLIGRYINMDMPWHTNGVTWRKDFFKKIGGWNDQLRAWQDWEIHCRSLFFKPKLQFIEKTPDNYFRMSKHDSIGKTIRSNNYMDSVYNALVSIDALLVENEDVFDLVKTNYEKLLCKMLISFPVRKGFLSFPIKTLSKTPFFKGSKRLFFLKFYIIELLAKSPKLKKAILQNTYAKQRKFVEVKSNYLKHKISDL
ncbi:glycosyltransferase family 2 protein [Lacinutrix iliipiscaria]|uniref:Glycosyltransferase family 2 protein n=1 Tax=Lacinutrix iliipiscaria TaxID=1230532 RepID=A0ABW5WM28_9FLAO